MIYFITFLLFLPLSPASPLQRWAKTVCDQYGAVTYGSYSMLTNLWDESSASSGRQCSTLESIDGNAVSWRTTWAWTGGNHVKSFSNIQLNAGIKQQLGAITTMPSYWEWSLDGAGVLADVSFDLFISDTADVDVNGPDVKEIMVWLASFGVNPISSTYDSDGKAVSIASNLAISGYNWNLYSGSNGYHEVYSFLPEENISSFSGDILGFFSYLMEIEWITSSHYLVTAQAGTEVTSGTATFKTSAYSLTIS